MTVPKPGEVWELGGLLVALVLRPRPDLDERYGSKNAYFDVVQLLGDHDSLIVPGTEDWVCIEADRWERLS